MDDSEFKRYRMDLYNQFHRCRRICRDGGYHDVKHHIPGWFDLLKKIDGCTTLEQRFELAGTNVADRGEILKIAKEFSAPVTTYFLLSAFKGANSATHRGRSGEWRGFDRLSAYLGWYVVFNLPKGVGMTVLNEFFGSADE